MVVPVLYSSHPNRAATQGLEKQWLQFDPSIRKLTADKHFPG